jgi:hypothetical protein
MIEEEKDEKSVDNTPPNSLKEQEAKASDKTQKDLPPPDVILMPESSASSMTEANFEPDKGQSLIYFKFVSMNQPCIKNAGIRDTVGQADGYFVYGTIPELYRYFHEMMDKLIESAHEGSKLNP